LKRTLRELRILRLVDGQHTNIVRLYEILQPHFGSKDLYASFELMDTDLAEIIRSPQQLTDKHIQHFTYQLLLGLEFLHSGKILHRDIK
jgi:serine/threonine protein kinase